MIPPRHKRLRQLQRGGASTFEMPEDREKYWAKDMFRTIAAMAATAAFVFIRPVRPLAIVFILSMAIFFGFFPYYLKCGMTYDLLKMCLPARAYTYGISMLLWFLGITVHVFMPRMLDEG